MTRGEESCPQLAKTDLFPPVPYTVIKPRLDRAGGTPKNKEARLPSQY